MRNVSFNASFSLEELENISGGMQTIQGPPPGGWLTDPGDVYASFYDRNEHPALRSRGVPIDGGFEHRYGDAMPYVTRIREYAGAAPDGETLQYRQDNIAATYVEEDAARQFAEQRELARSMAPIPDFD